MPTPQEFYFFFVPHSTENRYNIHNLDSSLVFFMPDKQIELIIQRACAESFSDSEKYIIDDFLQETGGKNPANWTVIDADLFISRLDGADVSNEFLSGAITRLAQLAPAHIVSRVLGSDRDGDGIPLYEELKLGTRATEYDSPQEVAVKLHKLYVYPPSLGDIEL